jgi:hypothetical protein
MSYFFDKLKQILTSRSRERRWQALRAPKTT